MAYEKTQTPRLVAEARDRFNQAENLIGQGMARLDEVERRVAAIPATPAPTPTPAPAPEPAFGIALGLRRRIDPLPDVLAKDIPSVDFGVDPGSLVKPVGPSPSAWPDIVGAFRITQQITHVSNEDFWVFPGEKQPRNHSHTWWGNPTADAFSTYESLARAGVGSGEGGAGNRSSKAMPSLLTGDKRVIVADYVTEYYKQMPAMGSARFKALPLDRQAEINRWRPRILDVNGKDTGRLADTVPIPAGLRYIIGHTLPDAFTANINMPAVNWVAYTNGHGQILKESPILADVLEVMEYGQEYELTLSVRTPPAWDGVHASKGDHHSHLSYMKWSPDGFWYVPETHPHLIPGIEIKPHFHITPAMGDPKLIRTSTDITRAGDKMHLEYEAAWLPVLQMAWHDNAINGLLNCSSGTLGDGRQLIAPPCFDQPLRSNIVTPDANGFARLIDASGNRVN